MRSQPLVDKDAVMEMIRMVLESLVFGFGDTIGYPREIEDKQISTDLYDKPTDTQLYLDTIHYPCHPNSTKKRPVDDFRLRIRGICEKE